jgi:hypothetical protein
MEIAEDVLHTIETAAPITGGSIMLHSGELFYKDFACELIAHRTQREFVAGSQGSNLIEYAPIDPHHFQISV